MMQQGDLDRFSAGDLPTPLLDPLGMLLRRWKWMLATLVAGIAATAAVAALLPASFHAETTFLVARQQVSESLVAPTVQDDAVTGINALMAQVLSRESLAPVIEELNLYPDLRDEATMTEIVAVMESHVSLELEQHVRERGEKGPRAQVYSLGFEADDPETAAAVANKLTEMLVDANMRRRYRQHQLTTAFLERELRAAETRLREQNRAVTEFKQSNLASLPDEPRANLDRLAALEEQRQRLLLQLAEAEIQVEPGAADAVSQETSLAQMREELTRLRGNLTENHPDVMALRRSIEALELEAADESSDGEPVPEPTRPVSNSRQRPLEILREQLAATESELERLRAVIASAPSLQSELAALEEKSTILREQYLELLRKVQDAQLAEQLLMAQQGDRLEVMSAAEPPSGPMRPVWMIVAAGLLASLALAALTGVALDLIDPVLVSVEQLERIGSAPVLGSVGRIG